MTRFEPRACAPRALAEHRQGFELVLRCNQMIQPIRTKPRSIGAVLSQAAVNHLFDPEPRGEPKLVKLGRDVLDREFPIAQRNDIMIGDK